MSVRALQSYHPHGKLITMTLVVVPQASGSCLSHYCYGSQEDKNSHPPLLLEGFEEAHYLPVYCPWQRVHEDCQISQHQLTCSPVSNADMERDWRGLSR
jgi:hypothetical protein